MEAYAVVETGGKQYLVTEGQSLDIELLDAKAGQDVELDRVLALSDGESLTVGAPVVEGSKVVVTIDEQIRGEKVYSFKKKRRKGYHRKVGHRQELMHVTVKSIG